MSAPVKTYLRPSGIFIEVDAARWNAPGARRARRATAIVLVGLALYGSVTLVSMLHRSPFQVAVERACALGGWSPEQVHFSQGHYAYRYLYSVVTAELLVDTPEGRRPVSIRLRNDPFTGWTVEALAGARVDPGVRLTSSN